MAYNSTPNVGASELLPPFPQLNSFNHLAQEHPAHRVAPEPRTPLRKSGLCPSFDTRASAHQQQPQVAQQPLPPYSSFTQALPAHPPVSAPFYPNSSLNRTNYPAAPPPALNFEELQRATPIAPPPQPAHSSVPTAPFRSPFVPPPGLYNQPLPPIDPSLPADSFPVPANTSQELPVPHPNRSLLSVDSLITPPLSAVTAPTPLPPQLPQVPERDLQAEEEARQKELAKKKAAAEKRRQTNLRKAEIKRRQLRERAIKAAVTRKKNREEAERLKAEEEKQRREQLQMELTACEPLAPDGSDIRVGDHVFCRPSENFEPERAEIVKVGKNQVYVHFMERDRRMDRWIEFCHVTRAPTSLQNQGPSSPVKLTRAKSRQMQERNPVSEREVGNEAVARAEAERERRTAVKNVGRIVFGMYLLDAWYFSPFPMVKQGESVEHVFMCQYCLKYSCNSLTYHRHITQECTWKNPPGAKIYDDPEHHLAVYEIDGLVNMAYCQRLTLLGKLFLDHKTLFFDVAPFLFYIVTVNGEVAGFFSKERPERKSEYNLACLLTLPHHQKKGVGRFLISLSYLLGKYECGKANSPERPLSDLGQVSYKSYWSYEILRYGETKRSEGEVDVPVEVVSRDTGIREWDVIETIKKHKVFKMWKGSYSLDLSNVGLLDEALAQFRDPRLPLRPELLNYTVRTTKESRSQPIIPKSPAPSLVRSKQRGSSSSGKKRGRPKVRSSSSPRTPVNGSARVYTSTPVTPARSTMQSPGQTPRTPKTPRTPFRTPARTRAVFISSGIPKSAGVGPAPNAAVVDAMRNFCETNTPEKVLGQPDSKEGLPTSAYAAFAKNMNIKSTEKARKQLFEAAQQCILMKHRKDANKMSSSSSTEGRVKKKPRINGPSSSGTGGGKDVGFVSRVMSGPETDGQRPRVKSSPRRSGGLVRGRMVSGFTGVPDKEEEEDDEDEEMEDEPDKNANNVTEPGEKKEVPKDDDGDARMEDVGATEEVKTSSVDPTSSIQPTSEIEEVVTVVSTATQKTPPRPLSRMMLEEEEEKSAAAVRVIRSSPRRSSEVRMHTSRNSRPKQPIEIIEILDTDDEA